MYALSLLSTWLMNVTAYPGSHGVRPLGPRTRLTAVGGAAGVRDTPSMPAGIPTVCWGARAWGPATRCLRRDRC